MKKLITLTMFVFFLSNLMYSQETVKINEIATLDSSLANFVLGRQAIVLDKENSIHLFYAVYGEAEDSVLEFTSNDNGITWTGPELVTIFTHSSIYIREHIKEISAAVDENNNIHLIYRYDGPPYYISGWDDYPPSHINYVEKVNGIWTVQSDVINDESVQEREGNGNTVCYLGYSQLLSFNNMLHYAGSDYAWWATKYHIIYSNTSNGSWLAGDTLRTFDLGDYDNIMLQAPSLIVNNDSLFAIWYQRYNCTIEMKKFDGSNWSSLETIFTDKYFPAPHPTSYTVRTGSVQESATRSVTAMFRSVPDNYNELILISKNQNSGWRVDTTQLSEGYNVEPSIYEDTTYIYLYGGPNYKSSIVKFTETSGFTELKTILPYDENEQILNIKTLSDASLPFVYVVRNPENVYYLKIGRLTNVVSDVDDNENNVPVKFELSQNYPNPFNPTTNITYVIARSEATRQSIGVTVQLKVYDMLGREVATLVNKKQSPGKYSVQFDASGLPSGVYFYTLRAGDFVQTRKMVLLK